LLSDRRSLLGLSDAGAHVDQLCDAVFSTYLLGHWVREKQTLPLEYAVWKLTGQPAQVLGLTGRGVITPGAHADLVAFDPASVAPQPMARVFDLPGGADRLLADSLGVEHVWVAGEAIRAHGEVRHDARPGTLLRHGISA
jgi:N-acyl-D-amino-acid deacylase